MGEMVASRSMQMLLHLEGKCEYASGQFEVDVKALVLLLRKIEKLLISDGNSRKVKENIRKIRNLVYTIEDALETVAVKVEEVAFMPSKNEKKKGFTTLIRRNLQPENERNRIIYLTSKFVKVERKLLIKWFDDTFPPVFESVHGADIQSSEGDNNWQWTRLMYPHDMENHFVEMKEDLEKLVKLVVDQDEQHRVVSIYGVKGLGKTNLARRVYIDPKVRYHFNAFAWVSLHQCYQIDDLLQNIVNQLDARAVKKSSEEKMKVSEEKKGNLSHGMKKPEGVKKNTEEQEKGVENKKEYLEEKREGTEDKESFYKTLTKIFARAVRKMAEGVDEKEEREEGVDVKKERAEVHKKGVEKQEKGAEKEKEGGEGQEKGAKEHEKGEKKKIEGAHEQEKGAEEQEEGVDENKQGAEVHKKGTEKKEKGAEKIKEGGEGQEKGEHEKGAEEMKEDAEEKGEVKKSAAEFKKGAKEKKEGVDETKEGDEEQSKSSEETVMDQLKEILRNQRCFIVIDDVSEFSKWEDISSKLFMEGAVTRVLLTTENNAIAARVGLSHELRCLNDDEGWELLQKYAFRGKKVSDLGLMPKLGKEMVQQCGGLPSKISSLGRILSKMSSLSEWHKVNDDVAGYLKGNAEQSERNERQDEQSDPINYDEQSEKQCFQQELIGSKVHQTHQPSENSDGYRVPHYNELPYFQKQCFLYLAMFKEAEGVDPEDLSFLWMAEGMVSTDHQLEKNTTDQQLEKKTIMDTTEYYLQKLASMLHVQVDELSTNRRFMPLSLRNELREWSLYLGEKEDFRLKVVDFSGGKQPRFDRYILFDRTRRLVIHFNKLSSPGGRDLNATKALRSLLFLNSDREYVNIPVKISDFSEFILLRVLHFVRCKFEGRKLPEGIWKLLNLRYFGVLYCDLDKLPPSITNFRNLQVLNVRSYDESKMVIPNVISQMQSLKHVRLPSYSDHEQPNKLIKMDGLNDLETLDGFNADIHDLNSLSKLEKLQHLSTRAYSNGSLKSIIEFVKSHGDGIRKKLLIEHTCDLTSPEAMPILEELLTSNLNALTFSMVVLPMFPNCGKFASKQLTQIKLIGCKLTEDPMEALGKFPDLRKLCLGYGAFIGTKIDIRDGGFPSLEYLEFRCLPNLEEWNVDEVAMQKLSTLIVRKCPKLKGIPDGLASLTSLNMEIELPQPQYNIYKEKFSKVKNVTIRELDPLHGSGAH